MVVVVVVISISHETTLDDAFLHRMDAASWRCPVATAIFSTMDVARRRRVDHRGGHPLRDGGQSKRRPAAAQGVRHRSSAGLTKTSTVVVLHK
jgi:hypothetical protein